MKLTKPHLTVPKTARHGRFRRPAIALTALSVAATSVVVVFGQVQSASALSKPTAATTGVRAGTHLKVYNGNLEVTKAGTVLSGLDIRGFVYIKAANVTLKNSVVRGGVATTSVGLVNAMSDSARNFHIHDVELAPQHPSVYIDGIMGWGYKATRLNIHGTVDGAKVLGNNVFIQYSYIHDLKRYMQDPYQNYTPSHNDGVQVLGGRHIRILYNNFVLAGSVHSGLQVGQNRMPTSDLKFIRNWSDGATCAVNMTPKPLSSMGGITVSDNNFGPHTSLPCTIIAKPEISFTAKGNMMDATDTPARVRILP